MPELINQIENYFDVSGKQALQIEELFKPVILKAGDFYLKECQVHKKLAFVMEGFLRIHRYTESKSVTQWISSPGEFVTDLAVLSFDSPARWNIEAVTDVKLLEMDAKTYAQIDALIPNWPKIEKLFIAKCFLTLEDRIFSFISMSAEERYQMLFDYKKELLNAVPHHYIASMIGMTPETLSRIRKKVVS
ncbi:Crp/Fnr family transcriptional regulator [Parvicella tangerina]|uniref:Cyclic nucleotide-binding domain-containing protein n=1 Tax=Parvicella tangerina TaxID=2829795 RepID=A0A916NGL0_9FLAO|nr:Crp/Fnr family transcriptional regulator [Parvicella tangerina]CAG5080678.1 hypothetical protein CRYO30217_01416 [Parvicella tangerina]